MRKNPKSEIRNSNRTHANPEILTSKSEILTKSKILNPNVGIRKHSIRDGGSIRISDFGFRISKGGFSLIELLVVTVIMGIVLGGLMMSSSAYSGSSAMTKTVTQLVLDLEALQTRARFAMHTTRLVRQSTGYKCSDDNDSTSPLNLVRKFPQNISWAPSSEFAPDGAEIIFPRTASPTSDGITPLPITKNELVIWVPNGLQKTVEIVPVLGRIDVR